MTIASDDFKELVTDYHETKQTVSKLGERVGYLEEKQNDAKIDFKEAVAELKSMVREAVDKVNGIYRLLLGGMAALFLASVVVLYVYIVQGHIKF